VVFVLGLAEGTLPSGARDDALLPDAERLASGGELPLIGAAHDEERRALLAALSCAPERVLSWAQADPRRGRSQLPSRWLLAGAGELAGAPVTAEELAAGGRADAGLLTVASFEAGLSGSAEPATVADYDLAVLTAWCRAGGRPEAHFLPAEHPRLAAGLEAVAARRSARFTRFDGSVGQRSGAGTAVADVLSPTSLEAYATCPMRYFLRHVLRVSASEKPEEIVRLSAMEKGALVHGILEEYLLTLLDGQPRDLARLLAIAERRFGELERRGVTGKHLTWQHEQELIRRELRRFFAEDDLTPLAAELVFGMNGQEPVVVTLDDGREVRFRGAADRVDEDPEGRLVVTDYKTGGLTDFEDLRRNLADDPVDRGRKLQLPLYALAARQRYGSDRPVSARYWFTSERGRFEAIGYDVGEDVLSQLRGVLTTVVDGVTAGAFPARPGEPDRQHYKHCRWCDFDSLCSQDRAREWERKRTATPLSAYVALAEGQR
jgi:RecB family exonuclease